MKLISIILSFKNEENNIEPIVSRISETFKKISGWDYEIVFVNDNSSDNSEKVIKKLQLSHNITLINMSRNFGVSACVMAGFKNSKGEAVVYMDTDLQDPPELITDMLSYLEKGYDVVHTRRLKRLGEPKHKLFLTKIAYKFINFLSDIKLPIEVGDFKLISRKALNEIINMKEKNPYLRGLSVWVGFDQVYVDYVRQPRKEGSSKFNFFTKNPYLELIRAVTSFSSKPLYLGLVIGIFTIMISILLILYSIIIKLFNLSNTGVPSILISISFFSGVILLKLGIISLYLSRIYDQIKNRPEYIIKSVIKPKKNH